MLPQETVSQCDADGLWIRRSSKERTEDLSVIRKCYLGTSVGELIRVHSPFREHVGRVVHRVSPCQLEPRVIVGDVREGGLETVHGFECGRARKDGRLQTKQPRRSSSAYPRVPVRSMPSSPY